MGQPRFVPVTVQVSVQGAPQVTGLTNAFDHLERSADKTSSGGLRNAFNASYTLRSEMTALTSQIPIVGRFFNGLTADALRYIQQSRGVTAEIKNQRVAFVEFQKLLTSVAQGKGPVSTNLFHGFQLDAGLRDPKNAFRGFVQEFQKIEDPAIRSALAVELFGNKANAILPVLENTAAAEASMAAATSGVGSSMLAVLGPIALVIAIVATLAVGFGIAGKAAFDLAKLAADAGSEIHEATQKVNFSAETISGLGVAAKTSGSDLGTLTNALGTFDKNLQRARESDTKLAKQFRDFNIDLKDNETALRSVFRALAALPAGEKQVELALLAFGAAGKDVLAIVKETNGNIDLAIAKYQKMGLVISGDAAKAADEFNDQLTILELQIKMVGVSIGRELMPYVLTFIQAASRFVTQNGPAVRAWAAGTIESIKNVSHVVRQLASDYARVQTLGVEMTNSGALKTAFTVAFPVLDQAVVYLKAVWGWLDKIGSYTREPDEQGIPSVSNLADQMLALFPDLPDPAATGNADTLGQIGEAAKKAQLDVQFFGKNTHLAQFNRAVAEMADQIKKLSYAERNRANALLAQWKAEAIRLDQLEAAKKAREVEAAATKKANEEAARQAEQVVQANERFAGSLEALKQRHAELTATQSIARSELQKFEEALKKGTHKDINPALIEQMRSALKAFDADVADINRQKQLEQFGDRIRSLREVIQGFTVEGESKLRRVRKSLIDTFDMDPTKLDAFIDRLKGGAELSGPEGAFEAFRGLFSPESLAKLSALNQNAAEFVGWLRKAIQADIDLAAVETPLGQAKEEYNRLLADERELRDPVLMQQRFANELLRDHIDLQLRDFDASLNLARAQREIADATVYSATQANASVAEFLAQQKNITEIVGDAKIGVIQTTFDYIDRALDRWTEKLGLAGGLIKQIIGDFIRLALVPAFARMFGLSVGGGGIQAAGGRQQSAGGFSLGNIVNRIFGGGGGSGGVTGTPPFAGGLPIAATPWGLIPGMGGITAPASLSSQVASQGGIQQIINQTGGAGVVTGATARGGFSLAGLKSGVAGILPILAATLGMGLGGPSRVGSALGVAGAGLAGLAGSAFLGSAAAIKAVFALSNAPVIGTAGNAIAGLFGGGTFAGGVVAAGLLAAPLIIGAIILGRNAARRRDERSRDQAMVDALAQLQEILKAVRRPHGGMDGTSAIAAALQIREQYVTSMSALKDGKTRRIALQDVSRIDGLIGQIKGAAAEAARRQRIMARIVPEFATGGVFKSDYFLPSAARGLLSLPGAFDRRDDMLMRVSRGEHVAVMNPSQYHAIGGRRAFEAAGVPALGTGGFNLAPTGPAYTARSLSFARPAPTGSFTLGAGRRESGDGGEAPITLNAEFVFDGEKIVARGLKSSNNQRFVVKIVRQANVHRD